MILIMLLRKEAEEEEEEEEEEEDDAVDCLSGAFVAKLGCRHTRNKLCCPGSLENP